MIATAKDSRALLSTLGVVAAVVLISVSYGGLFSIPGINLGELAAESIRPGEPISAENAEAVFRAIGDEINTYHQRINGLGALTRQFGVLMLIVSFACLIAAVALRRKQPPRSGDG